MKKVFTLLLITLAAISINASKAVKLFRPVTLTDGTMVKVCPVGDEHVNYLLSSDGRIILCDAKGNYHVATQAEKDSLDAARKTVEEEQALNARPTLMAGTTTNKNGRLPGTRLFPAIGTPKVLVLMAQYSDVKFTYTKADMNNLMNSTEMTTDINGYFPAPGGGYYVMPVRSQGSLAAYYDYCSGGKFHPEFDIYGPYTLSKTCAYYANNGSNKISEFLIELCGLADSDVDFSQYDADNDGYVDLIYVLYAGFGDHATGDGKQIWPKSGNIIWNEKFDNKMIYRYGVNNELGYNQYYTQQLFNNEKQITGIGVICHEFGHCLGIHDFYVTASMTDAQKNNQCMEQWSLMDNGSNRQNGYLPTPLSAFERYLFGWIDNITELSSATDVTLKPLDKGGEAYKIKGNTDNEYWIAEAIPSDEKWYFDFWKYTGTGMLLTHINGADADFAISASSAPNNVKGFPKITIRPADDLLMYQGANTDWDIYNQSLLGDTYPGLNNVTAITDYWSKNGTVNKPITEIAQNTDYEVTFKFMGGATAVDNIFSDSDKSSIKPQKVLRDGKILILKDGKYFTVSGIKTK